MNDLIKREDAIGALNGWLKQNHFPEFGDGILYLVPSADRLQGEWKHLKGDEWLCSNCGHVVWTEGSWEHPLERGKDYCEHCGAHMKGADE